MFVDAADVVIVAELSEVGKDCIEVTATENGLTTQVNSSKSNYFKELALPVEVDPKSMATSYRNGV